MADFLWYRQRGGASCPATILSVGGTALDARVAHQTSGGLPCPRLRPQAPPAAAGAACGRRRCLRSDTPDRDRGGAGSSAGLWGEVHSVGLRGHLARIPSADHRVELPFRLSQDKKWI